MENTKHHENRDSEIGLTGRDSKEDRSFSQMDSR